MRERFGLPALQAAVVAERAADEYANSRFGSAAREPLANVIREEVAAARRLADAAEAVHAADAPVARAAAKVAGLSAARVLRERV